MSALEVTHSAPYGLDYYKGLSISRDYRHSLCDLSLLLKVKDRAVKGDEFASVFFFIVMYAFPFSVFTTFLSFLLPLLLLLLPFTTFLRQAQGT